MCLPDLIVDAALAYAERFGREVASDDLLLLSLTTLDVSCPARRVLADEGIDEARLLEAIRTDGDLAAGSPPFIVYTPAYYAIEGRAQGFAAALGDGRVSPEDVLLALIWDPMTSTSHVLARLGVNRERLVTRLRELGSPVPKAALPSRPQVDFGERIWFRREHVARVLGHLRRRIAPGTGWRFNYEEDRAWVRAEASVNLQVLVDEALRDTR